MVLFGDFLFNYLLIEIVLDMRLLIC